MDFYKKVSSDVVADLVSDIEKGLSSAEALERQKKYGMNVFSEKEKESIFAKILDNLKEPLILILIVSGLISVLMGHIPDGIGIFVAVLIATTIAVVQEGRSDKAFEALSNQSENISVKVARDGKIQYILKNEITMGDIIHLETGDKVPADGRIIHASNFKINESMLTGESEEVTKSINVIDKDDVSIAERKNMVYSGTLVVEGRATIIVTSIGDSTEIGKIAEELKEELNSETPLQEKLADLGKKISLYGTIAAAVIFLFEMFSMYRLGTLVFSDLRGAFEGIKEAFIVSVALIVAAVPEGLPTMVALTLAFNMQKMAKNNALVRKLIACETIGSVNIICSDKTGTLTQNKMTVMDVWCDGKKLEIDSIANESMLQNFCLNTTSDITKNGKDFDFIGNPTECSLLVCAHKNGINYADMRKEFGDTVCEFNFTSARKMMTSVYKVKDGFRTFSKGSPEKILALCKRIAINGEVVLMTASHIKDIEERIKSFQDNAKRVLAFASAETAVEPCKTDSESVEKDLIFNGFVGIEDPLRTDVKEAIDKCRVAGISVKILTGDNIYTATSIANQLGIIEKGSLTYEANEIEKMSDADLKKKLAKIALIARSNPTTKMRVVKLLKEMNNSIVVTGDGINDAPALKAADVGVAMGIAGTEVAKESADIVLLDDSFSTIVKAVRWGRAIYENFQRFIQFQLTVNVVAFATAIIAELLGKKIPFTTLQLLWVNIIMDGPPALSLGMEPPRDHLMNQEPIKRNASIVTKEMLFKILSNGFFIVGALIALMEWKFLGGAEAQQTTIVFTCFVLFQLWNAFNCREIKGASVFASILKNKVMLGIVFLTFLIQVAVVTFGGAVFKTVPLEFELWVNTILFTFSIIIFNEIISLVRNLFGKMAK